jgi:hypothetical protein
MSTLQLIPTTLLYLLSIVGDGCILVAIAVAASMGGTPWVWGVSFAAFHILYATLGVIVTQEVAAYSELLGNAIVLAGAVILAYHFFHHRLHHVVKHDCSCEHHHHTTISNKAVITAAASLSLHSLAAGSVARGLLGDMPLPTLMIVLVLGSLCIGVLMGILTQISETKREPLIRILDKTPGIVSTILSGLILMALFHTLSDLIAPSPIFTYLYMGCGTVVALTIGWFVHERGAHQRIRPSSLKVLS